MDREKAPARRRRGWNKGAPVVLAGSSRVAYPMGDARRDEEGDASNATAETIFHPSGAVFSRKSSSHLTPAAPAVHHYSDCDAAIRRKIVAPGRFSTIQFVQETSPALWLPCVYCVSTHTVLWGQRNLPQMRQRDYVNAVYNVRNGSVYIGPAALHIWNHAVDYSSESPDVNAEWTISYMTLGTGAVSWDTSEECYEKRILVWPFFVRGGPPEQTVWLLPIEQPNSTVVNVGGKLVSISSPPHFCGRLDENEISPTLLTLVAPDQTGARIPTGITFGDNRGHINEYDRAVHDRFADVGLLPDRYCARTRVLSSSVKLGRGECIDQDNSANLVVPAIVSHEFSSVVLFCNTFVLGKPPLTLSIGISAPIHWSESLVRHIGILSGAVTLTEPSTEGFVDAVLPPPPLYNTGTSKKEALKKQDPFASQKAAWKHSCCSGKHRQRSIANAIMLVLYSGYDENIFHDGGLISALARLLVLYRPKAKSIPVDVATCSGKLLLRILLELLSIHDKRGDQQQESAARLITSFFISQERSKVIKCLTDRSLLDTRVTYRYERDDFIDEPKCGVETSRLGTWRRGTSTSALICADALLEEELSYLNSGDLLATQASGIDDVPLNVASTIELFDVALKVLHCYLLFDFKIRFQNFRVGISQADLEVVIGITMESLGCDETTRRDNISVSTALSVKPSSSVAPSRNLGMAGRKVPLTKKKSICQQQRLVKPLHAETFVLRSRKEVWASLFDGDSQLILGAKLVALMSLRTSRILSMEDGHVSPFDTTGTDDWMTDASRIVAMFLYSYILDAMSSPAVMTASSFSHSNNFFLAVIATAESIASGLSNYEIGRLLRTEWIGGCRSWFRRMCGSCSYLNDLHDVGIIEIANTNKCRCTLEGDCTLSSLHELCSLLVSIGESSRSRSDTPVVISPNDDPISAEDFILILATEIHGLHVCWTILNFNIYELCQNLVDWPIDVCLQVINIANLLSVCLKNTLRMRFRSFGRIESLENKVLSSVERLVEDVVSICAEIKGCISLAVKKEILVGDGQSLFQYLSIYPFEKCKKELVYILSICYDNN